VEYRLKLYVAGHTARAHRAVEHLRAIIDPQIDGRYRLEIVDVLDHPDVAELERIVATPTLVKEQPEPLRRVIGDLSDRDEVLIALDLGSAG